MKILFVHPGAFSANSMNHIGPFAAELRKQGHETGITLPELDPSFQFFPYPDVPVFSYEEFLDNPRRFDGEAPQIVHAWTPREVVRQFCEKLWQKIETHLVIHLEDDELAVARPENMRRGDVFYRTDPLHGPWFVELADTFTLITESLKQYLPKNAPFQVLRPGFDITAAENNPTPAFTANTFGIPKHYKLITYPGGASGANSEDLSDLFQGIHLLNEHGTACLLLKTGFPDPEIRHALPAGSESWIRDVGFLKREEMWRLIELADLVVQPGRLNDYNRNRLPSKLPEFLCLGKPVITSSANLGQELIDGEQALLLKKSTAREIAARCQELFSEPARASQIAAAGKQAGYAWFDLASNTARLVRHYDLTLKTPRNPLRIHADSQIKQAIAVLEQELVDIKPPTAEALKIRNYLRAFRRRSKFVSAHRETSRETQLECQIYFPNEPGWLELGSIRRWYQNKKPQDWLFPFSPPHIPSWLRIDPGQFPGTYTLHSWEFLDEGRKVLFKWTPALLKTVTCQLTGASMGPVTDLGLEIWSLTHDPQMLFAPLPDLEPQNIHWLRLRLTANEIESPLTQPLRLRRKGKSSPEPPDQSKDYTRTIDKLLFTLERRRSPVLRMVDRLRTRIKG